MNRPAYVTVFTPPVGVSFGKTVAQLCKRDVTGSGRFYYRPILVGTLVEVTELVGILNDHDTLAHLPDATIENTP